MWFLNYNLYIIDHFLKQSIDFEQPGKLQFEDKDEITGLTPIRVTFYNKDVGQLFSHLKK